MTTHLTPRQIENAITSIFKDIGQSTDGFELQVDCPYCGGKKKLWINTRKSLVHCFKCNYKATAHRFLIDMGEEIAADILSDVDERAISADSVLDRVSKILIKNVESVTSDITLPEGTKSILSGTTYANIALEYMLARGFSTDDLEQFKVGYCMTDSYAYRVIIPAYMHNKLVYYTGRSWLSGTKRKYLNPKVPKSSLLFNYDSIRDTAVIMEGPLDAMKGGSSCVALFGKSMTMGQVKALQHKCRRVIIMLDPDARLEAIKLARDCLRFFDYVGIVLSHKSDPGSMARDVVRGFIEDNIEVNTNVISKLLLQ